MIAVFPVMIIELIICCCQASRFTYLLGLNVLYGMFETLYTAYYAIGLLAYIFAFISYLPLAVSFLRMAMHDTETRRLIFYRACLRMWLVAFLLDLWVLFNLNPAVEEICGVIGMMPDEQKMAAHFRVDKFSQETLWTLCLYKMLLLRFLELIERQLTYVFLVVLACTHYRNLRTERLNE